MSKSVSFNISQLQNTDAIKLKTKYAYKNNEWKIWISKWSKQKSFIKVKKIFKNLAIYWSLCFLIVLYTSIKISPLKNGIDYGKRGIENGNVLAVI